MTSNRLTRLALVMAASSIAMQAAATVTIVVGDPAGVGFNDTTPAAPIGGNTGTTLGQQRLIAFQFAANKWGATLTSTVPIRVLATWEPLTCTATGAVLGSAGATLVYRDFNGAPRSGAWFSKALANALIGTDQDATTADLRARFNVNLGTTGCLTGTFFYLGLDRNHGSNVDLVTVLLHEMGHGLGFQTFTSSSTGNFLSGIPSIWDFFLRDNTTGLTWNQMTSTQRVASSINTNNLVWNGPVVTAAAPQVLAAAPRLIVTAPSSIAGEYLAGTATFGPALTATGVSGEVMPIVDTAPNTGLACFTLSPANIAAVNGKIAVVDRGTCGFAVKVANVQSAGAIGAIIVDNVAGSPPPALGGSDPTITIPAIRITQADGQILKNALATRTRLHSGVFARLGLSSTARIGADANGRLLMYAPNPLQPGSSVSHFDTSASPNLLMEPSINGDLTHNLTPPSDLTFKLLQEIGWQ